MTPTLCCSPPLSPPEPQRPARTPPAPSTPRSPLSSQPGPQHQAHPHRGAEALAGRLSFEFTHEKPQTWPVRWLPFSSCSPGRCALLQPRPQPRPGSGALPALTAVGLLGAPSPPPSRPPSSPQDTPLGGPDGPVSPTPPSRPGCVGLSFSSTPPPRWAQKAFVPFPLKGHTPATVSRRLGDELTGS